MFDRFNDDARALIRLAQEQAGDLGHGWTGTEHLLLGLVAHGRSAAAEVLAEAGLDLQTLREDVLEVVGTGLSRGSELIRPEDEVALRSVGIDIEEVRARVEAVFGRGALDAPVPRRRHRHPLIGRRRRGCGHRREVGPTRRLAPRAKKSLELALREALSLGHDWIGPEHVLLGMLRVRDGLAVQILASRGLSRDELRGRVLTRLGGTR